MFIVDMEYQMAVKGYDQIVLNMVMIKYQKMEGRSNYEKC